MPPKRAAAGRHLDLSVKGGGALHSPEPELAEKTAAELEVTGSAPLLQSVHDDQ